MRRPTTAVVLAGAVVGACLLTGCAAVGTGTAYKTTAFSADSMSPAAAVTAATAATATAGSASVHLTVAADGSSESVEVRGVAALDGSTADLRATISGDSGPITVHQRLVDGVAYLRVEGSDVLPPVWVKLDPSALPEGAGEALGDVLGGAGSGSVTAPLDALREVADVEKVGTEDLDGIATTHYRATLDPAKAAAALGGLKGIAGTGHALGGAATPVDLWVDGEGHVVRMSQTLDLDEADAGSVTWTLDLREFGEPLDVTAPSGALDIGGLLGGLAGLGGDLGSGSGGGSGSGAGASGLDDLAGLLEGLLGGSGSGGTATS